MSDLEHVTAYAHDLEFLSPSDDRPAARMLYVLMGVISERCYSAGWHMGLEHVLWDAIHATSCGPASRLGDDEITREEIDELRRLSRLAGGWVYWRDDFTHRELPLLDHGPVFANFAEWESVRHGHRHETAR